MRFVLLAAACAGLLSLAPAAGTKVQADRFQGTISCIDATQAKRMTGVSWRPGCPVHLRDLRNTSTSSLATSACIEISTLIVREGSQPLVIHTAREVTPEASATAEV